MTSEQVLNESISNLETAVLNEGFIKTILDKIGKRFNKSKAPARINTNIGSISDALYIGGDTKEMPIVGKAGQLVCRIYRGNYDPSPEEFAKDKQIFSKLASDIYTRISDLKKMMIDTYEHNNDIYGWETTLNGIHKAFGDLNLIYNPTMTSTSGNKVILISATSRPIGKDFANNKRFTYCLFYDYETLKYGTEYLYLK